MGFLYRSLTAEPENIKNCPFCGGEEMSIGYDVDGRFVYCDYCESRGAICDTAEKAKDAWENRQSEKG